MCISDVPRSVEFDDVYFSAQDGLAETRHVFLDGNGLPDAWKGIGKGVERDGGAITIAETGFGTGLNFLAVWKLFDEAADSAQKLHFISVEKYPLSREVLDKALAHWTELDEYRVSLCKVYPDMPEGVFTCDITDRVRLTIYFEDVVDAFLQNEECVDFWFLDGFKPSSNPQMWRDAVFEQMARLSHKGTRFATFTAAGFVRRGLAAVGFDVRKVPGFGRKRDMSVGVFMGEAPE